MFQPLVWHCELSAGLLPHLGSSKQKASLKISSSVSKSIYYTQIAWLLSWELQVISNRGSMHIVLMLPWCTPGGISVLHVDVAAKRCPVLLHPGVTVIGEVNAMTSHLMNVLWLVGTFTFATVIGIITEDVTSTIMVRSLYPKSYTPWLHIP